MPPVVKRKCMGKFKVFVKVLLRRISSILLAFPKRVECNLCGWSGRRFLYDGWHENGLCPRCDSQIRHRLLIAVLENGIAGFPFEEIFQGRRILHFAPEPLLAKRIKGLAKLYITTDPILPNCNLKLDMADMKEIHSSSVDVLIACDVLEHVKSDKQALAEVYRVLVVGGLAIFTVPQKDGLERTLEDLSITTPGERERLYGIADHWRIYGTDFGETVKKAGFQVKIADHENFPESKVRKFALFPYRPSSHPLATNHRRIFLARKSSPIRESSPE